MTTPPIETAVTPASIPVAQPPALDKNLRLVAAGSGATFVSKLFLNALRLISAIWLARLLGANQLGLYNLGLSALNLSMGIALFGLDAGVIRYIAIQAARKDEQGVWGTIQIGLGISILLSAVLGILLFVFSDFLAVQFFKEPRLVPLLRLASVFVPVLTANDSLGNILKGFKKIQWSSLAMFVYQPIVRLAAIAVVSFIGMTSSWAIVTYGIATLASSLVMIYFLQKHFGFNRPFGFRISLLKEIVNFSFPVWLSGLMAKFQNNIQAIFIGTMSTITGVGVFSVASQVTMISGEFSSSITTASKPIIAELHERKDIAEMNRIYQMTNKWVVTVQVPIFLLMIMLPAAILSIFGQSFVGGATALIILAIADLLNTATGMGGTIIDMTGYTRIKLINSIARLTIYIVLDLLLIPKMGMLGAAIAVLAGEGMVNIARLIEVYIIFRILPFGLSLYKPITAGLIALATLLGVRAAIPLDSNIVIALLQALVFCLIYAAASLLLGFTTEELALAKNLFKFLNKKKAR